MLPQITGLALALGAVVGGALVTEIVFGYPGLGTLILTAIQNHDYFLLQGIFLFIIVGVLVANFIIDIAYVVVDPRTRLGMQGGKREHRRSRARGRPGRSRRGPLPGDRATARDARRGIGQRDAATSRCATGSSLIGLSIVLLLFLDRDRRPAPRRRRPVRVRRAARAAAVERSTGSARPRPGRTSTRSSSTGCARASWSARSAAAWPRSIGMVVGFTAGYRGGIVDEVLNMLTNVVLVIPTLAVLIIIAAYLPSAASPPRRSSSALTSWPWAARAIRAQTFSLAPRDFVGLARLSGRRSTRIIVRGDRAEHELVPVPDVHPPLRRLDPHRRHARLHRARPAERDVARPDDEQRRS